MTNGNPTEEGTPPDPSGILDYTHRVWYGLSPEAKAATRFAHRGLHRQHRDHRKRGHGRHPRKTGHGRHPGHRIHRLHPTGHGKHFHSSRAHPGRVPAIHFKKHDPFHIHFSLRNKEHRIAEGLGRRLIPHGHMTPLRYIDYAIYRQYGILVYNTDYPNYRGHVGSTNRGPRVGHQHHPALGHRHTHLHVGPTQLTQDLHFSGVNSPAPHYTPPPSPHIPPVFTPFR